MRLLASHVTSPAASIDPTRCPLCGVSNTCAATAGMDVQTCWCMHAPVSPQALASVPPEARRKACLCPRCASGTGARAATPPAIP